MAKKSEGKIQHLGAEKSLQNLEGQETSTNLSKNLALKLMSLIEAVNSNGVTPETVNASCNAANQIHKVLDLNYRMKKDGF